MYKNIWNPIIKEHPKAASLPLPSGVTHRFSPSSFLTTTKKINQKLPFSITFISFNYDSCHPAKSKMYERSWKRAGHKIYICIVFVSVMQGSNCLLPPGGDLIEINHKSRSPKFMSDSSIRIWSESCPSEGWLLALPVVSLMIHHPGACYKDIDKNTICSHYSLWGCLCLILEFPISKLSSNALKHCCAWYFSCCHCAPSDGTRIISCSS